MANDIIDKRQIRFKIKSIVKKYKNHMVGPINFDIFENETLVLKGQTGCGKTTIAKIIMRTLDFESGDLFYKGSSIFKTNIKLFRNKNQMMFQNSLLSVNPLFTVKKIIVESLKIQRIPILEIEDRLKIILDFFELPKELLLKYPNELSGGELQRVVFARTLIVKPEFIILDEPFSNLNKELKIRLIDKLNIIKDKFNIGMLIITHSAFITDSLSDRVLEFSNLLESEYS